MKKKLLNAALKAAPLVMGASPTTRDLRSVAVERAARWATERVTGRSAKEAKEEVRSLRDEGLSAADRMRAKLRRAAPAASATPSRRTGYAAKGLAAAALTLPLGLWVGSRLRERV